MQVVLVTRNLLESVTCTAEMLRELLTATLGYSEEAATKIMADTLAKAGGVMKTLSHAKARTVLIQKLSQHETYGADFNAGRLRVNLECLATPEEPKAKQEQKAKAEGSSTAGRTRSDLSGPYYVVKKHVANDEGKDAMRDEIWANSTFEDYFKKAPAKGFTSKTNRPISAAREISWALKMGWIIKGVKPAEEQQQAEQQAA